MNGNPPADFRLRAARPADAEAVAALHVASWRAGYAGIVPAEVLDRLDPAERAVRMRQRYAEPPPQTHHLVAVDVATGAVAGLANAGPYRRGQRWDDPDPTAGEVYAIYADPRYWGRGVGRLLMDGTVAALRADGRRPVRLWVLTANDRARRFYERYGFTADGTVSVFALDGGGELPELRFTLDTLDG
jgi:ribosomal protein S18 acetylase RimI-like enzyme